MRVYCKHVRAYIISAHTPYMGSSENGDEGWTQFLQLIPRVCRQGVPILIGTDGNYQAHVHCYEGGGKLHIKDGEPPSNHVNFMNFI